MIKPGPVTVGSDEHTGMMDYAAVMARTFGMAEAAALGVLLKLRDVMGECVDSGSFMSALSIDCRPPNDELDPVPGLKSFQAKLAELGLETSKGFFYLKLDGAYVRRVEKESRASRVGKDDGVEVSVTVTRGGMEYKYVLGQESLQLWEPGVDVAYFPEAPK